MSATWSLMHRAGAHVRHGGAPSLATEDEREGQVVAGSARKRPSWRRRLLEWAAVIMAAALVAFLVRSFVFEVYSVPSSSMMPTIRPGDRIVVDKLFFNYHDLHPGDIVVFRRPPRDRPGVCAGPEVGDLVKRIVGLPGQTVSSKGNTVLVNGKPLAQPYLPAGTVLGRQISPPVHVPPDHYFVLGDNRDISCDSRYWGTIKGSSIVGTVIAAIWRNSHPWLHTF